MARFNLAASNIAWSERDNTRVMQYMANLGFSGLEIAPTKINPQNPYFHAGEAKEYLDFVQKEYGLKVCSMQSIWRGQQGNIFVSEEAEKLLLHTALAMGYAEAIGCPNLVFGCPGNRNMPPERTPDDVRAFFEECGNMAARHFTMFSLEANPAIYHTNFLNTTEEACDFLKSIPFNTGLAINLDFGAVIQNGEEVERLASIMPLVNHVHISEPRLAPIMKRSEHEILRDILIDSRYRGYVSLEMGEAEFDVVCDCLAYMAEVFA